MMGEFFFGKAKIQLAQPYIKKWQQSESAPGRRSRVEYSGISAAINKVKAYLAQRYINHVSRAEAHLAQQAMMGEFLAKRKCS